MNTTNYFQFDFKKFADLISEREDLKMLYSFESNNDTRSQESYRFFTTVKDYPTFTVDDNVHHIYIDCPNFISYQYFDDDNCHKLKFIDKHCVIAGYNAPYVDVMIKYGDILDIFMQCITRISKNRFNQFISSKFVIE